MHSEETIKAVKKLLRDGFNNLKVISFEFDIPIEQLWEYKREIDGEKNRQKKTNKSLVSPVKKMREKYNALISYKVNNSNYFTEEEMKAKQEDEKKLIDIVVNLVEQKMGEIANFLNSEKYNILTSILRDIARIKEFTWSNEQATKMAELIGNVELDKLKRQDMKDIIASIRRTVEYKLAESIRREIDKAVSVEELEELSKSVKNKNLFRKNITRDSVLGDIQKKITLLKQKEAVNKIRNDFSQEVRLVILRNSKWRYRY